MTTTEKIHGRPWTRQIQIVQDDALDLLVLKTKPAIALAQALRENAANPTPRTALILAAVGADSAAALGGAIWDAARLVDAARQALARGCEMDGRPPPTS